jgi:AcrR family transcriptional regulator
MPLQTFLNLKTDRQKEILDTAFEEFAIHPYTSASVGRIIKKLGIAKGSFYRYFSSKKDLYFFLIKYASDMRLLKVKDLLYSEQKSLFEILVENFLHKLEFDLEYPLQSGFLYNVIREKANNEIGNMEYMIKADLLKTVIEILKKHRQTDPIRSDIDIDLMAFMIIQVQFGIFDYLTLKYKIDFHESIRKRKSAFSIPREEIRKVVEEFSTLLKEGFIAKSETNENTPKKKSN